MLFCFLFQHLAHWAIKEEINYLEHIVTWSFELRAELGIGRKCRFGTGGVT